MTDQLVDIGPVRLELPPVPTMSRVARLTATGVAALAGFSIEKTDDINVVVSEVMVALIEHGARSPISITFEVRDGGFTVRATTEIIDFDIHHPDLALCRTVLAAVSTSHDIEPTPAGAAIWATVQQSRP